MRKRQVKLGHKLVLRPLTGCRYQLFAAAGIPHTVAQAAVQLAVEGVLGFALGLQRVEVALIEQVEGAEDVLDLRFDHVHHRVVAEAGVRAHEEEQVGEAGGHGALVGLRAIRPAVDQVDAVAPVDGPARNRVGRGEASAEDDGVDFTLAAVAGQDAAGAGSR